MHKHPQSFLSQPNVCYLNLLVKFPILVDSERKRSSSAIVSFPFPSTPHLRSQSEARPLFQFLICALSRGYRHRDFYEPVNRGQFSTTDNGEGEKQRRGKKHPLDGRSSFDDDRDFLTPPPRGIKIGYLEGQTLAVSWARQRIIPQSRPSSRSNIYIYIYIHI